MTTEKSISAPRYNDGILCAGFVFVALAALAWWALPPAWLHGSALIISGGAWGNPAIPAAAGMSYLTGYLVIAIYITLLSVLCIAAFIFASKPPPNEVHISGPQLLEGKQGIKSLQFLENKLFSKAQKAGEVKGLIIGGVELSRKREVAHIRVIGLPGAGKTVLMNNIILQIIDRKERMIIHDPKGDYTAWLPHEKHRQRVIFGPWDKRGAMWDIAADIDTPAMASTFAGVMFPTGSGGDQFWNNAARECFASIIRYCQRTHGPYKKGVPNWSFDTIADILGKGGDHVIEIAQQGNPDIALLLKKAPDGKENKTADNVMATIMPNAAWIGDYAAAFDLRKPDGNLKPGFSIIKFLKGEYHNVYAVILKNDSRHAVRAQQIFGALMGAASNYINGSEMPEVNADEPGLWVILDEYPQLGTGLGREVQKMEELGRSRGVRVIKALQDESQLYEQYGREKGRAQNSVQQTRIYCKTATETAREVAGIFGNRTVQRISESYSSSGTSQSLSQTEIPVLTANKLTSLAITQTGAELIINIDSEIIKTEQTFAPRELTKEIFNKTVNNELWDFGAFRRIEKIEANKPAEAAAKAEDKKARLAATAAAAVPAAAAPAPAPVAVPAELAEMAAELAEMAAESEALQSMTAAPVWPS